MRLRRPIVPRYGGMLGRNGRSSKHQKLRQRNNDWYVVCFLFLCGFVSAALTHVHCCDSQETSKRHHKESNTSRRRTKGTRKAPTRSRTLPSGIYRTEKGKYQVYTFPHKPSRYVGSFSDLESAVHAKNKASELLDQLDLEHASKEDRQKHFHQVKDAALAASKEATVPNLELLDDKGDSPQEKTEAYIQEIEHAAPAASSETANKLPTGISMQSGMYKALVQRKWQKLHLGVFPNLESAVLARKKASNLLDQLDLGPAFIENWSEVSRQVKDEALAFVSETTGGYAQFCGPRLPKGVVSASLGKFQVQVYILGGLKHIGFFKDVNQAAIVSSKAHELADANAKIPLDKLRERLSPEKIKRAALAAVGIAYDTSRQDRVKGVKKMDSGNFQVVLTARSKTHCIGTFNNFEAASRASASAYELKDTLGLRTAPAEEVKTIVAKIKAAARAAAAEET